MPVLIIILQQLKLLFITFSFITVGFSIMRLFKELQEVAQPGVHPKAGVSRDGEFMGTRSRISCVFTSHCFHSFILPKLIIPDPTAGTTNFFIANLGADTLLSSEYPTSQI